MARKSLKVVSSPKENKTIVATIRGTKRKAEKSSLASDQVGQPLIKEGTSHERKKRITKTLVANNEADDDKSEPKRDHTTSVTDTKPKVRKTKTVKSSEPLAERSQNTKLCVGAHVSSAGGVHNAITNLVTIGANAFALFLKSHKKWQNPDLDPEHAKLFLEACKQHDIDPTRCCVPHGSYLVNLGHPDPERKKQAYTSFVNDLTRCQRLGIQLYNFHPGNASSTTRENSIRLIADSINEAHEDPATGEVVALLETMATLGNTIGGTFADLSATIALVKDKSRVGVCLDTCHVFAAGYDLRTPEAYASTMEKFDEEIGLKYLKAFHVNDSKAPLGSHRDLHARIGTGYLGLRSFHNLMNDERFHGLPMVLETPVTVINKDGKKVEDKAIWAREIKLLERLVDMDTESDGFKMLEAALQEEGKEERERIGGQVERKTKATSSGKKAKKNIPDGDEEDTDE